MDITEYYGHPLRHDFIRDTFARNSDNFYRIIKTKMKFLENYSLDEVRTEFEVWKRIMRRVKSYSLKTTAEPDGRLDIILALKGIGEKEGIGRILCIEIKDGQFNEKDLLKYKEMENNFHNMPVIPMDSSEDPLLVLGWNENINLATNDDPNSFERSYNWAIRFMPLEQFFPLLQQSYKEIGRGIV